MMKFNSYERSLYDKSNWYDMTPFDLFKKSFAVFLGAHCAKLAILLFFVLMVCALNAISYLSSK